MASLRPPRKNTAPKGYNIKRLLAILVVPLAIAASLSFCRPVSADVNVFTVTNFAADYYLTNQDPQGQMKVVEQINVKYTDFNHGILRAIPDTYKSHPQHVHIESITSSSGAPSEFTTSTSNGNLILKIGDPNRTVTGAQEYTITYTEDNVITFYNDHDELYWDVNGDQWNQPFSSVQATIHLPSGLKLSNKEPICYSGSFGSKDQSQCVILSEPNAIHASASNLQPNQTVTVVAGFQKGYFHPYRWIDYAHDYLAGGLELLAPIVIFGGLGFIWWFRRGRDAKGKGVIIPQYDAPDDLKPVEVGAIVDFTVDNRDITATIVDLAIRKYLKIIENDKKKLLGGKSKTFSLQLVNKDWTKLNDWERQILTGLFGSDGSEDTVDLSKKSTKLYTVAQNVRKDVEKSLTDRGYFKSNPIKYVGLSAGTVIILSIVFSFNFKGIPALLIIGGVVGLIIFGTFYHHLSSRTDKGVAAKEYILGLKMYMEVAEKDRLKMLQGPDAKYAEKTDAPQQTVQLFEKLLPYAIALQVEQQWAKKFENIYRTPPDWYSGNYTAFNTGYLIGSLNGGFAAAVGTSFAPPSSSSGSGFGGGGGAGGGGGGGGGGGW